MYEQFDSKSELSDKKKEIDCRNWQIKLNEDESDDLNKVKDEFSSLEKT